ncbi:hypothetical protein CD32_17940 [Lysinibacillus odysseyi 34hs-1 = NBRC 100172]|uniref:Uncharacterized protein n=1 Tax=Lysinibacillus odysseyi 34hs-1 = NBRC 100172 TaxID=1220589 RepID=A0A0A3IGZ5_9BACI|nr:hypothetical protein CD32_17940 [Lysinibacillus odysseyi 34hs-1 = NBRC 100172]
MGSFLYGNRNLKKHWDTHAIQVFALNEKYKYQVAPLYYLGDAIVIVFLYPLFFRNAAFTPCLKQQSVSI